MTWTDPVCEALVSHGHSAVLRGFDAIDAYLGMERAPCVRVETGADTAALARIFEGLRFPGVELADAAVEWDDRTYYFRCVDEDDGGEAPTFDLLSFNLDYGAGRARDTGSVGPFTRGPSLHFNDPRGVYPVLRNILKGGGPRDLWSPGGTGFRVLADAALIASRYDDDKAPLPPLGPFAADAPLPLPETQRALLLGLLASARPERGLELLRRAGFVGRCWPLLAALDGVDHSKEFHPEGNAWSHTLETFRYRKGGFDARLGLGLLLHDTGKPLAPSSGGQRFSGHAEIGAAAARRFLEDLRFGEPPFGKEFIGDVCYLVKNHMLPAALPRLPFNRTQEIIASPLFPALMELYRCDESSSFKGLDGYYQSAAAYRSYLKNRRNPYRSADGKKLGGYRGHAAQV